MVDPKLERRLRQGLGGLGLLVALGGLALGAAAFFYPPLPRALVLPEGGTATSGGGAVWSPQELEAIGKKRLSKPVVKVVPPPPPPPPKPPVPPLDSLLRLCGVTDYGNGTPPEAMVELRAQNQTRSFRAGEPLGSTGATLVAIADPAITVEYDGRKWRLTFRGVELLPQDPVSGAKP